MIKKLDEVLSSWFNTAILISDGHGTIHNHVKGEKPTCNNMLVQLLLQSPHGQEFLENYSTQACARIAKSDKPLEVMDGPLPNTKAIFAKVKIDNEFLGTVFAWPFLPAELTSADKNALKRIYGIFDQDVPVVDGTRPELLPADLAAELHVKSDLIAVYYRRRRQELADKGWMLGDEDRIMGDVPRREATVIPSPARKNNPELARAWVHKAKGEHPRVDDAILKGEAERAAAAKAAKAAENTETAADDKEPQA